MTPAELVAELYEARIEKGLSLREVERRAELACPSGSVLSRWESGGSVPNVAGFVAVAEALGLEVIVRPKGRQR